MRGIKIVLPLFAKGKYLVSVYKILKVVCRQVLMKKLVLLISSILFSLAALQAQEESAPEAGSYGLLSKVVRPKGTAALLAEAPADNNVSSALTAITNQYFWSTFATSKNLVVKPVTTGGTAKIITKSPTSKMVVLSAFAYKVLVVDGPALLEAANKSSLVTVSFP